MMSVPCGCYQNNPDDENSVRPELVQGSTLTSIQPNTTYWVQSPRYQVISQAGGINSTKYFIHNNHLGSVALTTDVNGVVKQGSRYLPYDAPANSQNACNLTALAPRNVMRLS